MPEACTAFKGSHPNGKRQEVTTKHGSPMIKLFRVLLDQKYELVEGQVAETCSKGLQV